MFVIFPLLYTRYMLFLGLHDYSPCILPMYVYLLLRRVSAGARREALGGGFGLKGAF